MPTKGRIHCRWAACAVLGFLLCAGFAPAQVPSVPASGPLRTLPIAQAVKSAGSHEKLQVVGAITLQSAPGYYFLQDESGALRFHFRKGGSFAAGDRVRATVAEPNEGGGGWWTASEAVREGTGPLPAPMHIGATDAPTPDSDNMLVTVRGRVVAQFHDRPSYEVDGRRHVLLREILLAECDNGTVALSFDPRDGAIARYPVGTVAEFTGPCRVGEQRGDGETQRLSISVLGQNGVKVIEWPPFWMRPNLRTWLVQGAYAALCLGILGGTALFVRRQRSRLAQVSEMRFRALVENSFDAVLVFYPDGVLRYRNPQAERLFGGSIRGDLFMQSGASPKIHPDDAPRILATMAELLAQPGRTSSMISYRIFPPEGGMRHVEALCTNCVDIPGIEGVVVYVRDVTDRREAEERLREANTSLEQRVSERTADLIRAQEELKAALKAEQELSELRANFVSLVSHEFRTPLGVIMSGADVLRLFFNELPEEKRLHHLEMITRSARTLAHLIEEVLLIRRVEEGGMLFEPEPVNLAALCSGLVDEVQSASHGVCPIELKMDTTLDGAMTDETLLRHILSNLLSNAVKYSTPGDPVEFSVIRAGTNATFIVRDRGIGIPPEDRPRLFHSFVRGRNVGSRPGTGLGLIIVKRCVDLHSGTLELESEPGAGTTFTITLPIFTSQPSTS